MLRRIAVIAPVALYAVALASPCLRAAAAPTSYQWIAELATSDPAAKTVTVKIKIPDYVAKYLDRFKPDDQIVLVWDMIPPRPPAPPASTAAPEAPKPDDKAAPKPGEQAKT